MIFLKEMLRGNILPYQITLGILAEVCIKYWTLKIGSSGVNITGCGYHSEHQGSIIKNV